MQQHRTPAGAVERLTMTESEWRDTPPAERHTSPDGTATRLVVDAQQRPTLVAADIVADDDPAAGRFLTVTVDELDELSAALLTRAEHAADPRDQHRAHHLDNIIRSGGWREDDQRIIQLPDNDSDRAFLATSLRRAGRAQRLIALDPIDALTLADRLHPNP